jgi:predicted nuclease of predicted toxin-antitoxin system
LPDGQAALKESLHYDCPVGLEVAAIAILIATEPVVVVELDRDFAEVAAVAGSPDPAGLGHGFAVLTC